MSIDLGTILGPVIFLLVFAIIASYITIRIKLFRRSIMGQAIETIARAIVNGEGVVDESEVTAIPKSLSSMESLCLPRIERDFPEFNWNEWKVRVQDAVLKKLQAVDERDVELVRDLPMIKREVEQMISNPGSLVDNKPYYEHELEFKNRHAYRTVISGYDRDEGLCTIRTETSVSYERMVDVAVKGKKGVNGEVSKSSKMIKIQTVFRTELVYVQNAEKIQGKMIGYTCPNCGAPVRMLGVKMCEYCGTALEAVNTKAWSINKITECR